jgi:ubiquinone/menaquinone biosynthesis C-methylase UbiE
VSDKPGQVCPVEMAGGLDNLWRRWLQNPFRILAPFVREGMTALDVGCGPGFFTIPMAQLVGSTGRVIAADVQDGMLRLLKEKIEGTEVETRITLHKCDADGIGVSDPVDFVLLFYMAHEIPNQEPFFREIAGILRPTGQALLVEPPFHVSASAFARTLACARAAGLTDSRGPKMFLSKTALLSKGR